MEDYLALFDIQEENIGFVIGPYLNGYTGEIALEVNARALEEPEGEIYGINGRYTYENATLEQFLSGRYPEIIERFEERFTDAQLEYYRPESE